MTHSAPKTTPEWVRQTNKDLAVLKRRANYGPRVEAIETNLADNYYTETEIDAMQLWERVIPTGVGSSGATATRNTTTGVVTCPTGTTAVRVDGVLFAGYETMAVLDLEVQSGNSTDYSMCMRYAEGGTPNTSATAYNTGGNWAQYNAANGIYNVSGGSYCAVGAVSGLSSYVDMTTTVMLTPWNSTGAKGFFNRFQSFTGGSARHAVGGGYGPSATTAFDGLYFFPFAGAFRGTLRFYRRPL
jgi:hypothetical protein